MKLSIKNLRKIISETILLEGQLQDLLVKTPKLEDAYNKGIKKIHYLQWLDRMEVHEKIKDMIGLVKAFDQKQQSLKKKGYSPDINDYQSPGELRMALNYLDKSKVKKELNPEETDILGEFGDWIVVMPHTRESSCQLGKDTTWCTAATQSENLFYSYVGTKDEDTILYYIIKNSVNPRKDPTAKLSIGFVNGKPDLEGKDGGLSVDAINKGLSEERLKTILGDQFDPIIDAMKKHVITIGDKHPAKVKMKMMAKDPIEFEKGLEGLKGEERSAFIEQVEVFGLSNDVLIKLSNDKDPEIRKFAARNTLTPIETLIKLLNDKVLSVKKIAVLNPAAPPDILKEIFDSSDKYTLDLIAEEIALNPSTPPDILNKLSFYEDSSVRRSVARNKSTPPETLDKLSEDSNTNVRRSVAGNKSTPPETLDKLSEDSDVHALVLIALNPSTPPEVLIKLSENKDREMSNVIKRNVARNTLTPPEVLIKLSEDKNDGVRNAAAFNPSTPPSALIKLSEDKIDGIRKAAAENPTYQKYIESQNQLQEKWLRIAGLLN